MAGSGKMLPDKVRSAIKRARNKFRALDPDFGEIRNSAARGYRSSHPTAPEQDVA
jgi:hypothetical protein